MNRYLRHFDNIECNISYSISTSENNTVGSIFIKKPKIRFELDDQILIADGKYIYSYFVGSDAGTKFNDFFSLFFSENLIAQFEDEYVFECKTEDKHFIIEASSKEDSQILNIKMVFNINTTNPVMLEWTTISNQVTKISFNNVDKLTKNKSIFDLPKDVFFEGDFR